jgi:hypothetical protein
MCFIIFVSLVVVNLSRWPYVVEICFVSINFDGFRCSKSESNFISLQSIFSVDNLNIYLDEDLG